MISLTIQADIPRLSLDAACLDGVRRGAANLILRLVKDNFMSLGGRSYYAEAADATDIIVNDTSATVTVSHVGVRLRWLGSDKALGGPLRPGKGISSYTGQPTKLLAIPAQRSITEAPSAYSNLQYVPLPGRPKIKAMLIIPAKPKSGAAKAGKRRKGGRREQKKPTIAYWLASHTDHPANPKVMPTDDQLRKAAEQGAIDYLNSVDIIRRNGGIAIPANIIHPRDPVPRRQ